MKFLTLFIILLLQISAVTEAANLTCTLKAKKKYSMVFEQKVGKILVDTRGNSRLLSLVLDIEDRMYGKISGLAKAEGNKVIGEIRFQYEHLPVPFTGERSNDSILSRGNQFDILYECLIGQK